MFHRIQRRFGAALAVALACAAAHAQTYSVTPLAGPAQAFAASGGKVLGFAFDGSSSERAFVWDGSMHFIEPLRGDRHSMAIGADGAGRVYGVSFKLGTTDARAFLWTSGRPKSLGHFEPVAVAPSGRIVGKRPVVDASGLITDTACILKSGSLFDLATLGGSTAVALGINRYSRVVGRADLAGDSTYHACLWFGGSFTPMDLGTLGGDSSIAYAINDNRLVVGSSQTTSGELHALRVRLNSSGGVKSRVDLGTLLGPPGHPTWSEAYSVNNSGVIVGTSNDRAFIWRSGQMTDLNALIPPTSGWSLKVARSIDSAGRIVGWGTDPQGQPRAFLLTPTGAPLGIALLAASSPDRCAADFDGSGTVDNADLAGFLAAYSRQDPASDFSADGRVTPDDVYAFLTEWTAGCR